MTVITPRFSHRAREFLDQFTADLAFHTPGAVPQSQLVQIASQVPFECGNADGVYLIAYSGGTIASKKRPRGLEPTVVNSFKEMCALHDIRYEEIKKKFPRSEFVWRKMPPKPLDSGTME